MNVLRKVLVHRQKQNEYDWDRWVYQLALLPVHSV